MKNVWIAAALAVACVASIAKIPPPVLDDAAKAKAAETAAKTAWQGKMDAFLMCKVQDRVAAYYRSHAGSAAGKDAKMTPVAATMSAPTPTPAPMPTTTPTPTTTPAVAAKAPASAASAPAGMVAAKPAVPGGTAPAPAGAPTPTPCADPGAFAYNAPSEKPLETSGAHSPAGNATSPPSVRASSAEMAPAKK